MGNKIRVIVLVRQNRTINEPKCTLGLGRSGKATIRTSDLIRHCPPSIYFDRQQDKPQETEKHNDRYETV